MIKKIIYICIHCFCSSLVAEEGMEEKLRKHFFSSDVTSLYVSDWYNPSVEDYRLIQDFLREKVKSIVDTPLSSRPFPNTYLNEEFHGWITYRMNRSGGLVSYDETATLPTRNIIYFNNDCNDKRRCVICYVNYPRFAGDERDYRRSLNFLIHALEKTGFNGHFLYYVGGWPGLAKGRLKYVDCPYGFKPFLFEEAKDLGYENVLWLDACVMPVKSLTPIFEFLEKKGICFYSSHSRPSWREFDRGYASLMPLMSMPKNHPYEEVSTRVVGINMNKANGTQLLNEWLEAAEEKIPFLMSDEPAFMYIVNHYKLEYGAFPVSFFSTMRLQDFSYWKKQPEIILYHDYGFLDPSIPLPDDKFFNRS